MQFQTRAQLFKIELLLANVTLKIYVLNYGKYIDIFCWKNVSSFCNAKATHIFAAKISMYFKIP